MSLLPLIQQLKKLPTRTAVNFLIKNCFKTEQESLSKDGLLLFYFRTQKKAPSGLEAEKLQMQEQVNYASELSRLYQTM